MTPRTRTRPWCGRSTAASPSAATNRTTPVNTDADKALYAQYEAKAKAEPNTVFGGRLGTYKYYDMHNVIDTALTAYEEQVAPLLKK